MASFKLQNVENATIINIKQENDLDDNISNEQFHFNVSDADSSRSTPIFLNKIILGSKPCPKDDKKLKYEVKILIKDINKYLTKSERYCMLCQILFPKSHMLEHHKSVTHKIVRNNVNSKSIENADTSNSINRCFHCQVLYPSQESLIEHLYDVLEKKHAGGSKSRKTVPDNSTETQKSASVGSRDIVILKLGIDRHNNGPGNETCIGNSLYDKEHEISEDDQSISENPKYCEKICYDESSVQTNLDDIEIFCDIRQGEVFQCEICSYYFHKQKFYDSHMIKKHNVKLGQKNIVKYNPRCKFCTGFHTDVKLYNAHLHKRHSDILFRRTSKYESLNVYENKNENNQKITNKAVTETPILQKTETNIDLLTSTSYMTFKTILFKCQKCDVHFLSPNLAINHNVHNEMLINWRCSICKVFFKKNDEEIHSHQHLYTSSFKIYNMDASDISKFLIQCSKCAVYIPYENFTLHLKVCVTNVSTWLCTICEINLDASEKRTHTILHGNRNNKKTDFIIINDSIMNKETKERSSGLSRETSKAIVSTSSSATEETDSENNDADESEVMSSTENLEEEKELASHSGLKRKKDNTQNFVSKSNKIKRRKLINCVMDQDILYSKLNYVSQYRHKLLLNLTYCQFCECFITMYHKLEIHLERRCTRIQKRVCNICGLILTAKAITGHKKFHKLNPVLKLQDFTFYDIHSREVILPPIPKYPKCENCETHFVNKIKRVSHICNQKQYLICDICNMKFCSETLKLHIAFHGYYLKSKPKTKTQSEVRIKNLKKELLDVRNSSQTVEQETQKIHESQAVTNKYTQQSIILYTCESCCVSVDTYDRLIDHCHSHYDDSYKNIKTKQCEQCNLLFEVSSIVSHNNLHVSGVSKEYFRIFVVDIFHFGSSNVKWLYNIFKSLTDTEIDDIIKDSIYKLEYRVKLEISQEGSPKYTLYRCIKCGVTIDGCNVFKHRVVCQGNNKKYPCDYCGIALLSTALRSEHIKLHKQANISLKSYRIVVFNRSKDKTLNDAMTVKSNHYILYQCRICNGVVDRKMLKIHKCNIDDLKKCNHCGLLFYSEDYDKHISKHKLSNTFITKNMKVVLFGQSTVDNKISNDSSFSGIVYDYTFYRCIKCDVCIRHLRPSSKHFCLIDAAKYKCLKCHLVFDEGKKKGHYALHKSDVELTEDTMCVIPFDPQETYDRLEKEFKNRNKTASQGVDKTPQVSVDSIKEETDVIYKCGVNDSCGLHYVTKESAKNHVTKKKCHMYLKKHVKQTCSKCDLLFTSDVLFKHLLKHHGDKNIKYRLDIVTVKEEDKIDT